MMNQRIIRTGRPGGFSVIALPEIWASVTMFMSCTLYSYLLLRLRRMFATEVRGDSGFVQSNSAEDELAKLPFEISSVTVSQARHRRQPRHRRHQHAAMRQPAQVFCLASHPSSSTPPHR